MLDMRDAREVPDASPEQELDPIFDSGGRLTG